MCLVCSENLLHLDNIIKMKDSKIGFIPFLFALLIVVMYRQYEHKKEMAKVSTLSYSAGYLNALENVSHRNNNMDLYKDEQIIKRMKADSIRFNTIWKDALN